MAVLDDLGQSSFVTHDRKGPGGHGLERDTAEGFLASRWRHMDVDTGHDLGYVVACSGKNDTPEEPFFLYRLL